MDRAAFSQAARDLGLELSDQQLGAFEAYEEALYDANKTRNLTRIPREECWIRHFIDSLLCHDLFPEGSSLLDVGTGPGFPAWPLACARPDLTLTALDSNRKMLSFLESTPLTNLTPILGRVEALGIRERFDVVTGRAVAPLPIQLEMSAQTCKVGGAIIPMRTEKDKRPAPETIVGLGLSLESVVRRVLPHDGAVRIFPVFRKVSSTAYRYPRAWAEILRKPLAESREPL